MTHQHYVYVLLTDTGTLFTRLIKLFTSAPYNHASLALDEGLRETYSFGRKHHDNPWMGGFVREDIHAGLYSEFPSTRCVVLRVEVTDMQRAALKKAIADYERNKEEYRYNLLGLFGVMVNINYEPKNAFFCSQFVTETLRKAGVWLWDRPSGLVTPHCFLLHPELEVIYEGKLCDYPGLENQRSVAAIQRIRDVQFQENAV